MRSGTPLRFAKAVIKPHRENSALIPAALNIALLLTAATSALFLLWAASHAVSWVGLVSAAIAFSFVNNSMFSLLHEAVHGQFHRNPKLNDAFGRMAAVFFPTSYSMQRVFHLGHHQRNRSAVEQFDYLHPGDNKFFKYAQWYSILTGLYWAFVPLGCVVYLLAPWVLRSRALRSKESKLAQQSSADAMFSDLEKASPWWMRAEVVLGAAAQFGLIYALDLSLIGWGSCYAAFAFNWSSLQYADHAWSVLDVRQGAWNLRVNKIVQYLFLNYHHHLAHHQRPEVPWLYLPRYVDFAAPRPRFLSVYLSMWRGLRPFPDGNSMGAAPSLASPRRAELTCLRFNARFIRRHLRYLIVFLIICRYSLFRWRATRSVRFTYALAQHLDDVLDGDFKIPGEPGDYVDAVIGQLDTGNFASTDLGNLTHCVAVELKNLRSERDEPLGELIELLRVMRFDRERVRRRLLLTREELAEHHRQTFHHSVNLMLIAARAELRAVDAQDLVRAFGWCSTLRDLPEDIEKGLFNIPKDVVERAMAEGAKLNYASLTSTAAVRQWIRELHGEGKQHLVWFVEHSIALKHQSGARILALFAKSMAGFHGRYIKAHAEFFADSEVFAGVAKDTTVPKVDTVSPAEDWKAT